MGILLKCIWFDTDCQIDAYHFGLMAVLWADIWKGNIEILLYIYNTKHILQLIIVYFNVWDNTIDVVPSCSKLQKGIVVLFKTLCSTELVACIILLSTITMLLMSMGYLHLQRSILDWPENSVNKA